MNIEVKYNILHANYNQYSVGDEITIFLYDGQCYSGEIVDINDVEITIDDCDEGYTDIDYDDIENIE